MGLFSSFFGSSKSAPYPKEYSSAGFPFTALSIETASKSSKSICRIAFLVFDSDGHEIKRASIYIKPPGNTFSFSNKNGITAATVAAAPSFADVWPSIAPYIDHSIVAVHFSYFPIRCLSACLKHAGIANVSCKILDTHLLGQSLFRKIDEYTLSSVAEEACGIGTNDKDTMSKVIAITEIIEYAATEQARAIKGSISSVQLS